MRPLFALSLVFMLGAIAGTALAQRVEDYRNVDITATLTEYRLLRDGGTSIAACAYAYSTDGGFRRELCTPPYEPRTAAQRSALSSCLDNGEKVWALDQRIRADAGF